jgi:hypothetical protein
LRSATPPPPWQTNPADVTAIRAAIASRRDESVCLLNYRKDGTPFVNQFFLCPLHAAADGGGVAYHLGVQVCVRVAGACDVLTAGTRAARTLMHLVPCCSGAIMWCC